MVLCAARVFIATITRITHLQESYTATFLQMVSWRSMFVGRSMENRGVTMEDNEEEDFDDHFSGNAGIGAFEDDVLMEEPEVDVAENDPSDDLGQALHNVQADCEIETERLKFQKLLEDHHKLLYPDCKNGFKKLGTTLELLQWKATNGVSDKGFGEYSNFLKNAS